MHNISLVSVKLEVLPKVETFVRIYNSYKQNCQLGINQDTFYPCNFKCPCFDRKNC